MLWSLVICAVAVFAAALFGQLHEIASKAPGSEGYRSILLRLLEPRRVLSALARAGVATVTVGAVLSLAGNDLDLLLGALAALGFGLPVRRPRTPEDGRGPPPSPAGGPDRCLDPDQAARRPMPLLTNCSE